MSTPDGSVQFIPAAAQAVKMEQFNQEYAYAVKSRQHLWVAVQSHVLSKAALKAGGEDGPLLLDNESLRTVATCCYVCVEPYDPILLERKCKGEPR
jgi:hypothetical protein